MRKRLFRVSVTTDALREAKPRRQAINDRFNNKRTITGCTARAVMLQVPVVVHYVKAYHKIEIDEHRRQAVELIGQPEIGEIDVREW